MYERFTDRARKVMQLANQEAQRFNHEYIGTEHVLLVLGDESPDRRLPRVNDRRPLQSMLGGALGFSPVGMDREAPAQH